MSGAPVFVSIVIPVFNKLAFTAQCLDRIARHGATVAYDIIVIDNCSSDGTQVHLTELAARDTGVRYVRNDENVGFSRANNQGARLSTATYLLFLNNDTLVQPGWLDAMVGIAEADPKVGIVGIKQLFPYTDTIHHTGIIFTAADRQPTHIYPHANGSLPHVNKQREYQAVTGSCLLISRELFASVGMFDEGYKNGYEDIDLCLTVRQQQRTVVCCTSAFIYHYGQITETRTADDEANAARFRSRWHDRIQPDELTYFHADRGDIDRGQRVPPAVAPRPVSQDLLYFADDLSSGSALTWATTELVRALDTLGAPVAIRACDLPKSTDAATRKQLQGLMRRDAPHGGTQIRWSHYWPQHLNLDLTGRINLELFVINYLFARPHAEPWDYWLQTLTQNRYYKLPLSTFCREVLHQVGIDDRDCHTVRLGYSPEIEHVAAPARRGSAVRFLTVTNSHDLGRYGTLSLLEAYWQAFTAKDDVVLVLKDYGASSGDATLKMMLAQAGGKARVEYVTEFTSKEKLIELYRGCDAFVSAHRAEGYGMKILDALACGLPTITPLFGGPTDFCTAENSYAVDFSLVPVGDCYDTRALHITNGPQWAEPSVESLARQLRRVADDPRAARAVGERARQDVLGRLTWENAAKGLHAFIGTLADRQPSAATPPRTAAATERSPYWLGLRMSVVIPTYNRKDTLLECLRALTRQTILPQEFEVIVVDDGSTDGTQEMLASQSFPFALTYHRQQNQGPGTARNVGLHLARGQHVMYIGDDIMADARLLEEHLCAHATKPAPGTTILGHIDWAPGLTQTPVMQFVCGESSLQFAYAHIPTLQKLDFRFFYTSNISLQRQFLLDAADDGVVFDPHFRYAAFEDSELAFRLEKRGLEIHYRDSALAYHDHFMNLASFARREYAAGQMAVVFYRKHPQIDDQLQVRWIGDWVEALDRLVANPELDARLRALDAETDAFLRSLAGSLEQLSALQDGPGTGPRPSKLSSDATTRLLHGVFALVFDVERTRGKVEEWFAGVADRHSIEAAKRLVGCMRKLEYLSTQPSEVQKLKGTIAWLDQEVVAKLQAQIDALEGQSRRGRSSRRQVRSLKRAVLNAARATDLVIQQQLGSRAPDGWLTRYRSVREALRLRLNRPVER